MPRAQLAEIAVAAGPLVTVEDDGRLWIGLKDGKGAALLPLTAVRRGLGRIDRLWLRWRGPLGLAWKQREVRGRGDFPDPARYPPWCVNAAPRSSSGTRCRA